VRNISVLRQQARHSFSLAIYYLRTINQRNFLTFLTAIVGEQVLQEPNTQLPTMFMDDAVKVATDLISPCKGLFFCRSVSKD